MGNARSSSASAHGVTRHPKAKSPAPSSADGGQQFRVRMYRHGLGDCFLLQIPRNDGGTFSILIDCGLISVAENPKVTMTAVVSNIAATCGNKLDLVVLTHEHWDHVSGFSVEQVQEAFEKLEIEEVWYAWTEDPQNALGQKLRKERQAKLRALNRAVAALEARGKTTGSPVALTRAQRVRSLLSFFGGEDREMLGGSGASSSKSGKTRPAFEYAGRRRGVKLRYCYPKSDPVSLAGVPGVRLYVLGPPEDEGLLKRSAPTKAKEVYEFSADLAIDQNLSAAFERLESPISTFDGKDCPFDLTFSRRPGGKPGSGSARLQALIAATWDARGQDWRRIEDDWTSAAEALALNLDKHTNNTSLVLAFELVASGRVLLFAADAQLGNWLSWQQAQWRVRDSDAERQVTGPDLLRRTVFYKVGHHGSHNATLRALGLEQMTSDDLIAFVPVFKAQAEKNRWMAMPFTPLVTRLREKTRGRVVLSDPAASTPTGVALEGLSQRQLNDFTTRLTVEELYYEYSFDL